MNSALMPIAEIAPLKDCTDPMPLPVAHDDRLERMLREQEEQQKPKPAPTPPPRRAPYAYD